MADDFELADLGHVSQVGAMSVAKKFFSIDLRNIERRKFVSGFAGRRALEDQSFVLAGMLADFSEPCLAHHATSATAASMAARVVSSVQHHSAAFPSSG